MLMKKIALAAMIAGLTVAGTAVAADKASAEAAIAAAKAAQKSAGAVGGDLRRLRDLQCVAGDLRCAVRRFVDAPADLVRGGGLLLDGEGDAGLNFRDAVDDIRDLTDGADRPVDVLLDRHHPVGDVLGRRGGSPGELLDLVRDDGETAARFAGPRRLDGCVESEEVGLFCDLADDLGDTADLAGALAEVGDELVGAARRVDRVAGHRRRLL